jgi:aspartate 1-decarboxylase
MTVRTFVAAQIKDLHVTGARALYHGGITIGVDLLQAADIHPYEQVHVTNQANGERWVTYALPGEPGQFVLHGAGTRLGQTGDACDVITYARARVFPGACVLLCRADNSFAPAAHPAHGDGREPGALVYDQESERAR